MNTRILAVPLIAAAVQHAGGADFLAYLTEGRFVEVSVAWPCEPMPPERIDAGGFGDFIGDLDREWDAQDPAGFSCRNSSSAWLASSLDATEMTAFGNASGGTGPPAGESTSLGVSCFAVTFELLEPARCVLDLDPPDFEGSVRLVGPSLAIEGWAWQIPETHHVGELEPGVYEFEIRMAASCWTDCTMSDSFTFSFEVGPPACNPADLAEPFGLLDLADVTAFVTAFLAGDPVADLDGDGLFALADINAFVGAFNAGCP